MIESPGSGVAAAKDPTVSVNPAAGRPGTAVTLARTAR